MVRLLAILAAALVAIAAAGPFAQAQRAVPVADQIDALQKELAELREAVVQVPTLSDAVQDLTTRLALLEQAVNKLELEQKTIPDAVAVLDELSVRAQSLEAEIGALRTRVADIEQPWSPEASSGGAGVTYKDGFGWATGDGKYAITISGYMQPRLELGVDEDIDIETLTFRMRRARVGLSGHIGSPRLKYKLLLSGLKSPAALDYYLDYAIRPNVIIRAGQFKTPFVRDFMVSSTRLVFFERTAAVEQMRYDRDLGVGVHGVVAGDKLGYYVGLGNGAGPNKTNDNIDLNVVVRADAVVMGERFKLDSGDFADTATPALMVGAGAMHDLVALPDAIGSVELDTDVDGNGERDNVRVISASVDATFRYLGYEAGVEGTYRRESWGTIFAGNPDLAAVVGTREDRNFLGFSGQVSKFVLPKRLLVGARVSHSRLPFLGVGGKSSGIPDAERLMQFDGLVQLYSDRGYRTLGLMYTFSNYNRIDAPDPEQDKEHRFLLEAQLNL